MGRATVFMVGLAVVLALVLGVAYVALGAGGKSILSSESGLRDRISQLVGSGAGADQVLAVEPLARRRQIEVPRGYAQVGVSTPTPTRSKGINGIQRSTTDSSVYCFDLTFTPRTAVASAHFNNNATVGTILGSGVPGGCAAPYRDAAARTYAANTSAPSSDIPFGIMFI